ncbi:MAG: GNAT family N-acetyltransferase [Anaerovoracaceae bacterium]
MENSIIFRNIEKQDYNEIAEIISDTWNYRDFCTEKTAHKMGLLYLASCLCAQSFNSVALKDNEVVGVIMGNDIKNSHIILKNRMFLIKSSIKMLLSRDGRKIVNMFKGFENINEKLLKGSQKTFNGELSFFAVKEKTRGTGVGNDLYASLMEYFKECGIDNFYIFTDTSCNYGFYEHKGAERLGEKKIDFKPYDNKKITFFIYSNNIEMLAD